MSANATNVDAQYWLSLSEQIRDRFRQFSLEVVQELYEALKLRLNVNIQNQFDPDGQERMFRCHALLRAAAEALDDLE
jgi:hypothetical protein